MRAIAFIFNVDVSGLDVDPLQLQIIGRGRNFAECYAEALHYWARNQPELAERFTLDVKVDYFEGPNIR